jgi:hypothetical protein
MKTLTNVEDTFRDERLGKGRSLMMAKALSKDSLALAKCLR